MKRIQVFCDDISVWLDKNLNKHDVSRRSVEKTDEKYLQVKLFGIMWDFYIYGMNNTDMVPKKIKTASYDGCRPDIWFYDPINDKILLAIEETATAPVGNAQKQRIPRPMWAIENNIPFIYVSPKMGMDNSQNKKRGATGPFHKLAKHNPQSFITKQEYDLVSIMNEISKSEYDKYLMESPFDLSNMGKNKIRVKNTNNLGVIKKIINLDDEVYNVIEKTGNIYVVPKNSKSAKHFGFKSDTILIIGNAWKSSKSSGYSDPLAGGIMMMYYINKWVGSGYEIVLLSTHDCLKYDTNKLVSSTNKMTLALSKINQLIDLCGNKFKVTHKPNEIFKFNGVDESIATYTRYKDLVNGHAIDFFNEKIDIDFYQGPHSSWSSNDGLNTQSRDKKRADIYHQGSPNGEEGKTKLSDVYKHIKKYGFIHDKYYYLIEDCPVKVENSDKIIKVSFL